MKACACNKVTITKQAERNPPYMLYPLGVVLIVLLFSVSTSLGQTSGESPSPDQAQGRSLLEAIQAGGMVGYLIIALSIGGLALVVDSFIRIRQDKLIPPSLVEQTDRLAQAGKFAELRGVGQSNESLWGRLVAGALAQGNWGVDAVREAMQQEGKKQFTRLRQRVGYIGLVASIAPLLGLLGTVTGMIESFGILGRAQATAPADELAVGISEALITTCMGLIVAVPLMFFHAYLRDRVTQISQEASAQTERLLRIIHVTHTNKQREAAALQHPTQHHPAQQAAAQPSNAQPTNV